MTKKEVIEYLESLITDQPIMRLCENLVSFNNYNGVVAYFKEEDVVDKGCDYCNPDSDKCEIWRDSLTNDPYLEVITSHWDEYNDDWDYERIFINYCPYCGRKLY